jgi:uncharacterized damage-inducible protein DinB
MINADGIRDMYAHYFKVNRRLWDECVMALTEAQYRQPLEYSVGSIRNQCVHLMNVDERWFSGLRGEPVPDWYGDDVFNDRAELRAKWDAVEALMRDYLDRLTDDALAADFRTFKVWQVLIHVFNHGTDHRAQMLAMMHPFGVPTFAQDYAYSFMKR